MSRRLFPMAIVTGAVLAVGLATGVGLAEERKPKEVRPVDRCVYTPLNRTQVIDRQTLYIDDYSGRAALLHMSGACLYDSNEAVGLKFRGGSRRICGGLDVEVTGSITSIPTPSIIASVQPLDAEAAKAIRDRH